MKFECDSCHASYMIADEKVGKRGVKVKCKRCSHVIIVRPEKAVETETASADSAGDDAEASAAMDAAPPTLDIPPDPASALPPDEEAVPPPSESMPDDEEGGSPWSQGSADDALATPNESEGGATAVGAVPGWPMQSGADTEIGSVGSMPDVTMPGGAPPPSMHVEEDPPAPPSEAPDAPETSPSFDGSSTIGTSGDEEAPAPPAFEAESAPADVPPPPSMDAEVPAPPPDAGVDALDQQIAGAFSDMFGSLPDPNAMPMSPPPTADDVDQRGPTRVLDLAKMDALRAAAMPSISEEDPLDRLRTDVGPAAHSDDEPDPFAQAFKPAMTPASTSSASSSSAARPSMPDDSGGWHVAIDDEDIGPIRLSELVEHIEEGRAEPDALVWRSGMGDWTPANEIPEVAALLRARPMPKIPTQGFEPAGLDASGGVDGRKGGVLGDPFSVVADASDPNWRPHGLTEVYQAANLAEVASSVRSPALSTPAISRDEPPDESDAGWKPGAASALASLVADELKRIDTKPVIEEEPAPPALADDLGIGGALVDPPSTSTGLSHLALPEISGHMQVPPPQYPSGIPQQALPPLESFPPMPSTMSYVPAPAPRSPLIYAAGGALALILIIIAAALVKMAFLGPSAPVAVVEPRAAPAATTSTPAEPVEAKPAEPSPAEAKPADEKPPEEKPSEAKAADAKADAPEPEKPAEKPVAEEKEARASSSSNDRASKDPKPRAQRDPPKEDKPREVRSEPKPKPEPKAEPAASPPPKKKSSKDCDPILDIDCEEKKTTSTASSKKDTLTKADILAVVKKNVGKINACGKQHKVTGSVKVEWEIMKSGRTSSVRIGDPKYAGTPVGRCLVTEVQRWTFPAYTGTAPPPIKFPFKLE